ncbi:MAG: PLP-dependent aminotransferase family protein [Burkholderiaceae bacterium]
MRIEPAAALAAFPLSARAQSLRSSAVRDLLRDAQRPGMLSLAGGLPAPELFDVDGLRDATDAVMRDAPATALQYGVTDGQPGLRAELATLLAARGVVTDAGSIVVTTGSQQGLDVIARAVVDPGDRVAVESPAYLAALQVFTLSQARFVAVPVDADGARVDTLIDGDAPPPKLVYLVTNFGNPSGATLSRERRLRLLQWAVAHRVLLLEDDPYGELRVSGQAQPSLFELAGDIPGARELVVYLSSLSKVMAPGLRIGFAVLPPWLREAVVKVKQSLDLHTSTFVQEVAARYLASGRLAERMPRMREVYRERRDALVDALGRRLDGCLRFNRPDGGMFVWARFVDGTDSAALLPAARELDMIYVPGEAFYDEAPDRSALRLSFATATAEQLDAAVARLARAHGAHRAG